jgi:transcriptional regulator with XRE-family HTH domain
MLRRKPQRWTVAPVLHYEATGNWISVPIDPRQPSIMAKTLDTSSYDKRHQEWLADDDTRVEYDRARQEIEQIDAVIRSLDELREDVGMSKAELARRVGRNAASIRRLFTAEQARPELPLIISIANALDASVEIKPRSRRPNGKRAAPRTKRSDRATSYAPPRALSPSSAMMGETG